MQRLDPLSARGTLAARLDRLAQRMQERGAVDPNPGRRLAVLRVPEDGSGDVFALASDRLGRDVRAGDVLLIFPGGRPESAGC